MEQTNSIVDTQSMPFSCLDAYMMADCASRVIEAILIGNECLLRTVEPSISKRNGCFPPSVEGSTDFKFCKIWIEDTFDRICFGFIRFDFDYIVPISRFYDAVFLKSST